MNRSLALGIVDVLRLYYLNGCLIRILKGDYFGVLRRQIDALSRISVPVSLLIFLSVNFS